MKSLFKKSQENRFISVSSRYPLSFCLLFLVLLHICIGSHAQTLLSGIVKDANDNSPLIGANVFVKTLAKGTITDNKGNYSLQLPDGNHTVTYTYLGYESFSKTVEIKGQPVKLNVSLNPNVENLKEVVVTGKSEARLLREQAMPISVITMHELQGNVSDVSDVLSKTSGVQLRTSGGEGSATRISVRGLEGKRTGFFVNGTPLNDQTDFLDLNDIPIDLIDRIEIY